MNEYAKEIQEYLNDMRPPICINGINKEREYVDSQVILQQQEP